MEKREHKKKELSREKSNKKMSQILVNKIHTKPPHGVVCSIHESLGNIHKLEMLSVEIQQQQQRR